MGRASSGGSSVVRRTRRRVGRSSGAITRARARLVPATRLACSPSVRYPSGHGPPHPAPGHRRLPRLGRATARPEPAWQAGRGRHRGRRVAVLRGQGPRGRDGDAALRGAAAVPGPRRARGRRAAVRTLPAARGRDAAAVRAGRRGVFARRLLRRPHWGAAARASGALRRDGKRRRTVAAAVVRGRARRGARGDGAVGGARRRQHAHGRAACDDAREARRHLRSADGARTRLPRGVRGARPAGHRPQDRRATRAVRRRDRSRAARRRPRTAAPDVRRARRRDLLATTRCSSTGSCARC